MITWLRKLFHREPPRIEIETPWGLVSESARLRAALNMKEDPMIKARVEKLLVEQMGTEKGMAEARRRYPEAYEEVV